MRKVRAAVIGGSESGKTFRVIGYSRGFWQKHGLRSLVFDPWRGEHEWGGQAWVCSDFDLWKKAVQGTTGCVVIWDEASTYGGRDRENVSLFAEIRHRHPVLFAIGHSYSSVLPAMRVCVTDLFMSSADAADAGEWSSVMRDPQVMQAVGLRQYEFLHKRAFEKIRILRESPAEIQAGILP